MATNHLGHAALVAGLWPLLHAGAARVVVMSSTEARAGRLSAADDARAAAQPGAVRRPAGLPQHQAGQPAVRTGVAPPLPRGRLAGQRRRRAPRRQRHQPVRAPARTGRARTAGRVQQGRQRAWCCSRPPRARCPRCERSTTAPERRLRRPRPVRPVPRADPSYSTSTPPPRTRRRPRACGSSPRPQSARRAHRVTEARAPELRFACWCTSLMRTTSQARWQRSKPLISQELDRTGGAQAVARGGRERVVVVVPRLPEGDRGQPGQVARFIAGGERPPAEKMTQRVDAERRVMKHSTRTAPPHNSPVSPPRIDPVSATPRPNGSASPTTTHSGNVRLMNRRSRSASTSLA